MVELAHFRADDRPELVAASLACSVCLGGEVDWTLDGDGYDPSVVCACRRCGHHRRVFLDPGQALRLALAGPRR